MSATITSPVATKSLAEEHNVVPHRCERCGAVAPGFDALSDGDPKAVLFQCRRCGGMTARTRRWVLDRIRRQRG